MLFVAIVLSRFPQNVNWAWSQSRWYILIHKMYIYKHASREYWRIYREPGCLAVVWFGSSPTPPPPPVSELDLRLKGRLKRESTCWLERVGGWGGRGAESYNGEKAWSSINNLKFSASSPLAAAADKLTPDLSLWCTRGKNRDINKSYTCNIHTVHAVSGSCTSVRIFSSRFRKPVYVLFRIHSHKVLNRTSPDLVHCTVNVNWKYHHVLYRMF